VWSTGSRCEVERVVTAVAAMTSRRGDVTCDEALQRSRHRFTRQELHRPLFEW
jgi:hypothetical protein